MSEILEIRNNFRMLFFRDYFIIDLQCAFQLFVYFWKYAKRFFIFVYR